MTTTPREIMKGGANIHVKSHYRTVNGKMVYVADHDKMGSPVGTEAKLHERVQHGKNKAHLMAIDPDDRDTVLKHAGQLGIKPEVKYQGGKIKDHEGNSKAHGFHYLKFNSEDEAKKVHDSITKMSTSGEVDHGATPSDNVDDYAPPAQQQEPEQPEGKVATHPNDAVKAAEKKLQSFIDFGHSSAIKSTVEGKDTTPEQATAMLKVLEGGIEHAQACVDAADAYQKETGQAAPNANTYKDIVAKMQTWKSALEEKAKPQGEVSEGTDGDLASLKGKSWDSKGGKRTVVGTTLAGGKPKLMVQTEGQGLLDLLDPSELDEEIERDTKNHASHVKKQEASKVDKEAADKKQAEYDDTDGFADAMDSMKAGKTKKILSTPIMSNGNQTTIKELVRQKIADGWGVKKKMGELVLMNKDGDTWIPQDKIGGVGVLYAQFLEKKKGEAEPAAEEPKDDIEQSMGMPDPKEDAQGQVKDLMADAEKNFNSNPAAAADALKKAAKLAKEHGLKHTHTNGHDYDAAWMEKMAGQIEAAMPKAPAVDEAYTNAAQNATDASANAHGYTREALAGSQDGTHESDPLAGQNQHTTAMSYHQDAATAHHEAAKVAPTPELKDYHEKKIGEHTNKASVHGQAMEMHQKKVKLAKAKAVYASEASKADVLSQTADDHSADKAASQHGEDHLDAAKLHKDAAKAHTNMIQHALSTGVTGDKLANEHAAKATAHQKKADYHEAAHEAWTATDHNHHAGAAELHQIASKKAKNVGEQFEHATSQHDDFAAGHAKQAKPSPLAKHPNTKDAEEATGEAKGWSHSPHLETDQHKDAKAAHAFAQQKHLKASTTANDTEQMNGHMASAAHHGQMVDYHEKAKDAKAATDETEKFHGVSYKHNSSEHAEAAQAHEKAAGMHEALAGHKGIEGKQKHQGYHSEAALHHQSMAEKHKQFSADQHKMEQEDEAGDAAAAPANPWKGQDHGESNQKAGKALASGDIASAIKHYKHAAVVAHHNGDTAMAQHYATLAKNAGKSVQKAIDPQAAMVGVQEAARQLHAEKQQVRYFGKAVDTLPAAAKLQAACAKATTAGITNISDIVSHAVGGMKNAAPYLHFLSNVSQ